MRRRVYDAATVSLEVLLPNAEMLLPAAAAPWALAKVRTLAGPKQIHHATKADVARLLEAEAEKDVSARKLRKAPKASDPENQLAKLASPLTRSTKRPKHKKAQMCFWNVLSAVVPIVAKTSGGFAMDTSNNQSYTDELVGDLLVGKNAIKAFLVQLGMPKTLTNPYHLKAPRSLADRQDRRRRREADRLQALPTRPRPKDHCTCLI